MAQGLVTLFGGSGFIGRYATRALVKAGYRVRVAVRRPHLAGDLRLAGAPGWVDLVQANVRHAPSVTAAVEGADAVVNLVGILFESGRQTFERAQLEGARTLAEAASAEGVSRLVQISAIGADAESKAAYARTKAKGEAAVRSAFPGAVILRPSIVFGPEDAFFNRFADLARRAPFLPAIGGGRTRFQPVFVGDVADAIVAAITREDTAGRTFELGGPRTYSFSDLYDIIFRETDRKRLKLAIPFFAAKAMGYGFGLAGRYLPIDPPITAGQVEMLKRDNVVADGALTLEDLGVSELESVEVIVPTYLYRFRPYGQFHEPGQDH